MKDQKRIKGTRILRTPFADAPATDVKALVDRLMDPDRSTVKIKKEITRYGK